MGGGMIIGLGIDLVKVERVEKALARFGARFIERCFTEYEARICSARLRPAHAFAMRFAAKEAASKALGLGMRGLGWREMEMRNDDRGKPYLCLYGRAKERMAAMAGTGSHVSTTDDGAYAAAVAVIEGG
jgi:holo-[acyl-carrier protein] synthase